MLHADLAWAAVAAALGAAAWLLTWLLSRVTAAPAAPGGEASPGADDGA
ncbi:hypothetical protein ACH4PU_30085 [Streptomyces sp. NPDC021100]